MSTTPGETDLSALLSSLHFKVHPDFFVFATAPGDSLSSSSSPLSRLPLSEIQMSFREAEGMTVITTPDSLEKYCPDLGYQFRGRMITLQVHSHLEAVGFVAVIATKLAEKGISCNPVSGYHHDHLFVPVAMVDDALAVLTKIAEDARAIGETRS